MRLSKRGEFGQKAMSTLAEPTPDGTSPVMMQNKEISQRGRTLLTLKVARLLHGAMDTGGGYSLARSASEILIRQIFRSLDIQSLPMAPGLKVSFASNQPSKPRFYLGYSIVRL